MKLTTAFRQSARMIKSYRMYTLVNVLGLALSLACMFMISKYVYTELTANRFHRNWQNIYGLYSVWEEEGGVPKLTGCNFRPKSISAPNPNEMTEVEVSTRITCIPDMEVQYDSHKTTVKTLAADSNFYKVFDFPLAVGDTATLLRNPGDVVVTQALARRLWGEDDPLGKQLIVKGKMLTVAAVALPPNGRSSIIYELIVSERAVKVSTGGSPRFYRLNPHVDLTELNGRFYPASYYKYPLTKQLFQFIPLSELYLSPIQQIAGPGMIVAGNGNTIRVLMLVGLMVLVIGLFNFINIYTVTLLKRGKELGVKKVYGVSTTTMFAQFFCENLLMVFLACMASVAIVLLGAPAIRSMLGIELFFSGWFDVALLAAVVFVLPLLAMGYPLLRYRYATPITTLKQIQTGKNSYVSRALFLVAQYVMTITLIIVSLFFVYQLRFMLRTDLGYNHKNVILMPVLSNLLNGNVMEADSAFFRSVNDRKNFIVNELRSSPLVNSWSFMRAPYTWDAGKYQLGFKSRQGSGEFTSMSIVWVDGGLQSVYDVKILEGRALVDSLDGDTFIHTSRGVLLNQTAQRILGLSVGDQIESDRPTYVTIGPDGGIMTDSKILRVEGIVSDFHYSHLAQHVEPTVFLGRNTENNLSPEPVAIRFTSGREQDVIAFLQELTEKVNPGSDFDYQIFEEQVEAMYTEDKRVAAIYSLFALVSVFISSLGLFSLSTYDVQQRYKEIAIRRVNGATVIEIILLLTKRYYRLLLLAFVVAAPVAGYAIHRYLESFATRAPLSWWIFVLAGVVTALISLLTLWGHTYRAANENPARSIKSE